MSTHTVKDLSDRTVCTVEIDTLGRVWRDDEGRRHHIGTIERHGAGAWTARDMMGHTMAGDTRRELLHWLTTRPLILPVKAPEKETAMTTTITDPKTGYTLATVQLLSDGTVYRLDTGGPRLLMGQVTKDRGDWKAVDTTEEHLWHDTRKDALRWLWERSDQGRAERLAERVVPTTGPKVGDEITSDEQLFALPVGAIAVDEDGASYRIGRKFLTETRTVVRQDRLGQGQATYEQDTVPAGPFWARLVYLPA